jgi:phenylacetate-CoA ligase
MACGIAGWRVRRQRFSKHFHDTLRFLEQSDRWSFEALIEHQNAQLRRLIAHCYQTVPFYTQQFQELGIRPGEIQTRDDLTRLPILTKETVRERASDFLSTRFDKARLVTLTTSGTTGAGMSFYQQAETRSFEAAVLWRFRKRFGINPSQRHAQFGGRRIVPFDQSRPPYWRKNFGLNQVYFSSFHLTQANLAHYANHLIHEDYRYYSGYASTITVIAEYLLRTGQKITKPPTVINTGSETLHPSQRAIIERAFECPVADRYGAAEPVCSMSQCEKSYYHEDMELGIVERAPIEEHRDGQSSRIIGTCLVEYAMPLIRYDMGDIATFTDEPCPCGRHSPIARYIDGRVESYILTPDGRKIGRLARLFSNLPRVKESQVVQQSKDEILVRVVRKNGYTEQDEAAYRKKLTDVVGSGFQISFEYLDLIPRTKSGKFSAVVSRL